MQAKWWHGVVVVGLCVLSYTLGRTHAETQAAAQPIIAQQDNSGRTVNAPALFSPKETPAAAPEPGRATAPVAAESPSKGVAVATREQKSVNLAPVSGKAAVEVASRTLDDAINRRTWTSDDAQEFRHAIVDMPPEERERLIRQLTVAINNGQLMVTVDRGPPF